MSCQLFLVANLTQVVCVCAFINVLYLNFIRIKEKVFVFK